MTIPSRPPKPTRPPKTKKPKQLSAGKAATPAAATPQGATTSGTVPAPALDADDVAPDLPDQTDAHPDTPDTPSGTTSTPQAQSTNPPVDASTRQTAAQINSAVKGFVSDTKPEIGVGQKSSPGGQQKAPNTPSRDGSVKGQGRAGRAAVSSDKSKKPNVKSSQQGLKKRSSGNKTKMGERKGAERAAEEEADRQEDIETPSRRHGKARRPEEDKSAGQDREGDGRRHRRQPQQERGDDGDVESAESDSLAIESLRKLAVRTSIAGLAGRLHAALPKPEGDSSPFHSTEAFGARIPGPTPAARLESEARLFPEASRLRKGSGLIPQQSPAPARSETTPAPPRPKLLLPGSVYGMPGKPLAPAADHVSKIALFSLSSLEPPAGLLKPPPAPRSAVAAQTIAEVVSRVSYATNEEGVLKDLGALGVVAADGLELLRTHGRLWLIEAVRNLPPQGVNDATEFLSQVLNEKRFPPAGDEDAQPSAPRPGASSAAPGEPRTPLFPSLAEKFGGIAGSPPPISRGKVGEPIDREVRLGAPPRPPRPEPAPPKPGDQDVKLGLEPRPLVQDTPVIKPGDGKSTQSAHSGSSAPGGFKLGVEPRPPVQDTPVVKPGDGKSTESAHSGSSAPGGFKLGVEPRPPVQDTPVIKPGDGKSTQSAHPGSSTTGEVKLGVEPRPPARPADSQVKLGVEPRPPRPEPAPPKPSDKDVKLGVEPRPPVQDTPVIKPGDGKSTQSAHSGSSGEFKLGVEPRPPAQPIDSEVKLGVEPRPPRPEPAPPKPGDQDVKLGLEPRPPVQDTPVIKPGDGKSTQSAHPGSSTTGEVKLGVEPRPPARPADSQVKLGVEPRPPRPEPALPKPSDKDVKLGVEPRPPVQDTPVIKPGDGKSTQSAHSGSSTTGEVKLGVEPRPPARPADSEVKLGVEPRPPRPEPAPPKPSDKDVKLGLEPRPPVQDTAVVKPGDGKSTQSAHSGSSGEFKLGVEPRPPAQPIDSEVKLGVEPRPPVQDPPVIKPGDGKSTQSAHSGSSGEFKLGVEPRPPAQPVDSEVKLGVEPRPPRPEPAPPKPGDQDVKLGLEPRPPVQDTPVIKPGDGKSTQSAHPGSSTTGEVKLGVEPRPPARPADSQVKLGVEPRPPRPEPALPKPSDKDVKLGVEPRPPVQDTPVIKPGDGKSTQSAHSGSSTTGEVKLGVEPRPPARPADSEVKLGVEPRPPRPEPAPPKPSDKDVKLGLEPRPPVQDTAVVKPGDGKSTQSAHSGSSGEFKLGVEPRPPAQPIDSEVKLGVEPRPPVQDPPVIKPGDGKSTQSAHSGSSGEFKLGVEPRPPAQPVDSEVKLGVEPRPPRPEPAPPKPGDQDVKLGLEPRPPVQDTPVIKPGDGKSTQSAHSGSSTTGEVKLGVEPRPPAQPVDSEVKLGVEPRPPRPEPAPPKPSDKDVKLGVEPRPPVQDTPVIKPGDGKSTQSAHSGSSTTGEVKLGVEPRPPAQPVDSEVKLGVEPRPPRPEPAPSKPVDKQTQLRMGSGTIMPELEGTAAGSFQPNENRPAPPKTSRTLEPGPHAGPKTDLATRSRGENPEFAKLVPRESTRAGLPSKEREDLEILFPPKGKLRKGGEPEDQMDKLGALAPPPPLSPPPPKSPKTAGDKPRDISPIPSGGRIEQRPATSDANEEVLLTRPRVDHRRERAPQSEHERVLLDRRSGQDRRGRYAGDENAPQRRQSDQRSEETTTVSRSARLRAARGEVESQTTGPSDQLEQVGRRYLYGASDAKPGPEAPPEPQIQWSRHRGFGRRLDKRVQRDAEILTREERAVHNELLRVVPVKARMMDVRIDEDTSSVRARVVVASVEETTEWQRVRRDFEQRTGRSLDIDVVTERSLVSGPASTGWTSVSSASDSPGRKHDPDNSESVHRERRTNEAGSERPAVLSEIAKAVVLPQDARPMPIAAAVHAETTNQKTSAVEPVSSKRSGLEVGRPGGPRFQRVSFFVKGAGGGSAGARRTPRRAQLKRRHTEDTNKPGKDKENVQVGKDGRTEETASQRGEQTRSGVEERAPQERERGQSSRGGSSNCSTCGTLLPEAQANACPVCAQSGPDVMALTSIHYRAAGAKFLATVDLFNASDDARALIISGAAPSVVSLRYEQDIPGHKDFLKFKVSP